VARNKAPPDPRGGHVRLHWELLDSVAWRALSWADRGLYVAMRRNLKATNNGNVEATLGTLRHAGITSSATLAKGLRALMTAGFIDKTRQGGIAYGVKFCSLYRFTDEAVFEQPKLGIKPIGATNDWRRFQKLAEVRAAMAAAHAAAKRPEPAAAPKVQNLKHAASATESKADFSASVYEALAPALVQQSKQAGPGETRCKAA
jgi:hypothetical protein